MNVELAPGKYVVAVSGGVDSVVLLHVLAKLPGMDLVVAHFDHGMRPDSADDAAFVASLAADLGLPFVTKRVELGAGASEAAARRARYSFLNVVSCQHGDAPIVTAHHQDDVLETAVHHIIRGTGRRGLTALRSRDGIVRPLLDTPKQALIDYALQQKLSWHEDTTNHDERFTRNYIRNRLLVRLDDRSRQQLLALIANLTAVNDELDAGLTALVAAHTGAGTLDRRWFCSLPHPLAKEVLACWLRSYDVNDYDRAGLERLTVHCKVKSVGSRLDVKHGISLYLDVENITYTA